MFLISTTLATIKGGVLLARHRNALFTRARVMWLGGKICCGQACLQPRSVLRPAWPRMYRIRLPSLELAEGFIMYAFIVDCGYIESSDPIHLPPTREYFRDYS